MIVSSVFEKKKEEDVSTDVKSNSRTALRYSSE
jgi:hypothetical protein